MSGGRAQRLEDDLVEAQREMQYQREELQDALAARERGADELAAVLEQRGESRRPLRPAGPARWRNRATRRHSAHMIAAVQAAHGLHYGVCRSESTNISFWLM